MKVVAKAAMVVAIGAAIASGVGTLAGVTAIAGIGMGTITAVGAIAGVIAAGAGAVMASKKPRAPTPGCLTELKLEVPT